MFRDEQVEEDEKELFNKLIEKISKETPDIFPASDISKYLDMNNLMSTIQELMGGNAMGGYADGSAGCLPMVPGSLDTRMPGANIGLLSSSNIIPQ